MAAHAAAAAGGGGGGSELPRPISMAPIEIEEKGGGGAGHLDEPSLPPAPSGAGAPLMEATSAPPASPAPAGPPKREGLRALAVPLIRRYSQNIKDAASPWAVGPNSTRARAAEKERRQWEAGISKFNQKPAAGVELLINNGLLARTPEAVANFIRQRGGELSKRCVGDYVGSPDPFAQAVLAALLRDYDFEGLALDEAMRLLINDIRLPGESQQIDRILQRFAARYYACSCHASASASAAAVQQPGQPGQRPLSMPAAPFATEDCVYILSFSLMLLNTDLHNRNLRPSDKMRLEDFIRNNRGINNGTDLPRELLTGLYQSVKRKEMRMKEGDMYEPSHLTPFVAPRLSGWLAKESTGVVSRWKSHWFVLSNHVLYYFNQPGQESNPRCMILLESATAIKGPSATGTDILLYSHQGGLIKSVKIRRSNRRMVQGTRTRYLLRASSRDERDEWLVALQQETPALLRPHRVGSATTTTATAGAASTASLRTGSGLTSTSATASTIRTPRSAPAGLVGTLGFGLGLGAQHDAGALGTAAGGGRTGVPAYRCLAEGWMRRRSDVSRSWQRRYFMLLARDPPAPSSMAAQRGKPLGPRIELFYFTTQEMGQRQLELGLMTAQGAVPMLEGTVLTVKSADTVAYRLPEPGAAVWEMEGGSKAQRVREVVSPAEEREAGEGEGGREMWLQALKEHCPALSVRSF